MDDEVPGGDPPCWAQLFDEATAGDAGARTVDLAAAARVATADGAAWTDQGDDLSVNLLVFAAGRGIEAHVNGEVDVLLVGIAGEGVIEVAGTPHSLGVGRALLIPKGAVRAIQAESERFSYLSCHRRRGGLLPR